jgi:hypothetical protein
MIRLITMTVAAIGVGACASSGPQNDGAAVDSDNSNLVARSTTAETAMDVENAEVSTGEEAVIEYVEAPEVEFQAAAAEPQQRSDVICKRERVTGSHRMEKVCRSRGESEEARAETQKQLRGAQRSTGGASNSN